MSEPTLPPSPDDSDEVWGEPLPDPDDDPALHRLLDERPPHHDR